jgi:predicted metal-dependent hydrolase
MQTLEIGSLNIEIVRKDIKNIHLAVYPPNGRVRLATPLDVQDETIRLFVISKLTWIKNQQRKFNNQERQSPREYIERESHYFQGKRYLLRVTEEDKPPKVVLKSKIYLDLHIRPNTSLEQRQSILNEWYRMELKKQIQPLIEKWSPIIGVQPNDWQVKQMRTKWGTCNIEAKRIWINLELAKKPVSCLEFIVIHELVHLLERHHNDRFLGFMNGFLPNWKVVKEELNRLPVSHLEWGY